ncbi:MAG: DUF5789 family protein [Natrialbaceae archaeon]|nr:DUF5789 family protein [Natrialbaceae archaeon]
MSDEEEAEPTVDLGPHVPVEGAPLARVSSRLTWPTERSAILEREGTSVIRTPSGPQSIEAILEEVEETYFDRRQTFEQCVRGVIGTGAVETADE